MSFTHHGTVNTEEPKRKHIFFGKKIEENNTARVDKSPTQEIQKNSEKSHYSAAHTDKSPKHEVHKNSEKSHYGATSKYAMHIPNRRYNGGKVPHGWSSLPEHGQVITGTKFIAIKCPLSPYLFSNPNNFHLESFITNEKEQGREIGLIVDLTNTNRYYDPKMDIPKGIMHVKIQTRGHDEAPDRLDCDYFDRKVNEFVKLFPEKYIVVHCTVCEFVNFLTFQSMD
jgi:mRNA-capping enzyme